MPAALLLSFAKILGLLFSSAPVKYASMHHELVPMTKVSSSIDFVKMLCQVVKN